MNTQLKKNILMVSATTLLLSACATSTPVAEVKKEKTAFQTSAPWKPDLDVRADVAIVYGTQTRHYPEYGTQPLSFEQRVQSWRDRGYTTHFMTGIAWGEYQDYFTGKWDGKPHFDEGQRKMNGDTIWHGHNVPYIVPTKNYLKYMQTAHIKKVIDAGIDAIYLEEPEFWAFAGYSDAFKKEWEEFYGFEWRPQHESAENLYLSNKLKYHLYHRALNECFTYAKEYGKSKGMNVRCYVPTHSLINYSQWQIVSPEAALALLPCVDGYIAQVWTGTSRVLNYYNGLPRERVFETAFMEYGTLESMTAPTGRKVFFLTDPIEDQPRDWDDFRQNYQATFTAKLLYPGNNNYEVMPWPERIYEGLYQVGSNSDEKAKIPRFFSTQMQVMVNSLNQMPLSDNKVSGPQGISVLMGNSLMFQRNDIPIEGYEDPQLSNFFGLVMPLLKKGIPVKTMHIENLSNSEAWKDTKVLLMTYSNMKPYTPEAHERIAKWVKDGGALVYVARDTDPFQSVQEWWNSYGNTYKAPSDHLFKLLSVSPGAKEGIYTSGKGTVCVLRSDPKEFVMKADNESALLNAVKQLYEQQTAPGTFTLKNYFTLERGPFDLIAVMDESVSDAPYKATGLFIDLFDPELPVLTEKIVQPGTQAYLYNLARVPHPETPQVLAAASRVYQERIDSRSYSFITKSPAHTSNVMCILLPVEPSFVSIRNAKGEILKGASSEWNIQSKTCLLRFENDPEGVQVDITW